MNQLIISLYYVGVMVGGFLCGSLADLIGRQPIMYACIFGEVATGVTLYFSTNPIMFAVFRTFQGLFVQGLQSSAHTMNMELFPSQLQLRTDLCTAIEIYWSIGTLYLGVMAYFFRDWRSLELALLMPSAFSLLYMW